MKKRDPKTGRYVKVTADDIPAAAPAQSEFVRGAVEFLEKVEKLAGPDANEVRSFSTGIVIPGKGPLMVGYYPKRIAAALVVAAEMIQKQVGRVTFE